MHVLVTYVLFLHVVTMYTYVALYADQDDAQYSYIVQLLDLQRL